MSPWRAIWIVVERSLRTVSVNAEAAAFTKYCSGSTTNLGVVAMYGGNVTLAANYLRYVLDRAQGVAYVRLGVLDNLAQIALFEGKLSECGEILKRCANEISQDRVPARSWYDLAHQLTRCAYFERLERLGRRSSRSPTTPTRNWPAASSRPSAPPSSAPRPAPSPASANTPRPTPHSPPPSAPAREAPSTRSSSSKPPRPSASAPRRRRARRRPLRPRHRRVPRHRPPLPRVAGSTATATTCSATPARASPSRRAGLDRRPTPSLLLSDVATILGAGHSIDLLAHRVAAILHEHDARPARRRPRASPAASTRPSPPRRLRPTPTAPSPSACAAPIASSPSPSASVRAIDEISLLKSVADLVQVAVNRTRTTPSPKTKTRTSGPARPSADGDDTIFRSPRMVELLRIAVRLAATRPADPASPARPAPARKSSRASFTNTASATPRPVRRRSTARPSPRELVESQLFGHRRGAFTGAIDAFAGVIRAAERGTLFLDEVGDLELAIQPKLLRFLESGEIHPVGETKPSRVQVRIVAATNADLDEMVAQGRFRGDLFYRLGVAHLALPPLRERKDEIPALAALFLTRYATRVPPKPACASATT